MSPGLIAPRMGVQVLEHGGIGEVVRRRRLAAGWTVEALAYRSATTVGYISRLERGRIDNPGYRSISQIAVAFGCSGVDAMMDRPVITELDLQALQDERYGVRPGAGDKQIERVLAQAAQDAPASATRPTSNRPKAQEPRDAEPPSRAPGVARRGRRSAK